MSTGMNSDQIWTKKFWQPRSRYQSVCCPSKYVLVLHKLKPTVTVTEIDFHLIASFVVYCVSYSRELFFLVFRCLRKFHLASWPVSWVLLILVHFSCSSQWMTWAFVCLWTLCLSWVEYHNFTQFRAVICLYVQPVCRLLTDTSSLSLSINLLAPEFSGRSAIWRAHCVATLVAIRLFKGLTVWPL